MGSPPIENPAHDSAALAAGSARLIHSARGGCEQSLGELAERYRRYLLLVANTELSPALKARVGASDIVQETFLYVRQNFNRFTGMDEAELLNWLRQILHFRAMQAARHHNAGVRTVGMERPLHSPDESGAIIHPVDNHLTPCAQLAHRERLAALDAAIARLPEEYQRVIALRSVERRSFDEIGQLLDCSADAAQKRWIRALVRMRNELRGHG